IACHAGIAAARARGWQALVTDHHLPGATLPPADAIVNPNLPGDGFPSKALAGVGVVFYLLLALRAWFRRAGDPRGAADLSSLLDLVAVGTVADLVPLDANNRALVAAGLRRLRAGQACAGLRALVEVAGRDERTLSPARHAITGERRGLQQQLVDQTGRALARLVLAGELPMVPCRFDVDCHPGVVGLVASRIKERVLRPALAFAPAEPGAAML